MRELLHVFPDRGDSWTPKSKAIVVLNVDDNPVARQIRTRILRRGGFSILEAGCGAEALRLAKETLPSLILLDVRMPDMNGFAVCRRIRSDPRTAGIPVIHISSLGKMEHGYPEALDSGSDAYVKEPVHPELLIDLTRSLIRAAAAETCLKGCPLVEAVVHGGPVRNGELVIPAPDGEEIRVACNIAEGRLLEATWNSALDGMAIVDTAGNIVRMNPSASALFGIPDGEKTPQHMADLHETIDFTWLDGTALTPEEWPVLRSAHGETIAGLEMLIGIKATGEPRIVSYRSAPVCDSKGAVTHVVVNVHDITDRKKEEEERRQSELRWNTLAETVPDILMSSLDGVTCDYVNQRAVEYTGLPVRSINGTGWHQVVCPDDLENYLAATDLSRKNGEPLDREVRLRGADGIYRWFRVRFDPLRDAGGTIVKWVGAASNVDDLKRLEHQLDIKTQALEALNAGLRESNRDLQQFAATVAHDIQSPLNAISICCDELGALLADHADSEVGENLSFITSSAIRMRDLIRSVLEYARFDHDQLPAWSPVDCGETLAHTVDVLSPLIEASNSKLTFDPLPTVMGSAEQLEQVFQNLICNAIKYRRPDTPAHIHVSASTREGEWLFSVQDNGMGVEESGLDRMFKPFERLHPHCGQLGIGIGLTICQRVVERHGGRIWARSDPGQGSTFYFTIPR